LHALKKSRIIILGQFRYNTADFYIYQFIELLISYKNNMKQREHVKVMELLIL